MIQAFIPMRKIPTATHQEKQINWARKVVYDPVNVKKARKVFEAHLAFLAPDKPVEGPIRLQLIWAFPIEGKHINGEPKISQPDLDNMQKIIQDAMTRLGFWKDDSQIVDLHVIKIYQTVPGIYLEMNQITWKACDEENGGNQ